MRAAKGIQERLDETPRANWHRLFGLSKADFDDWWGESDIPPWSRRAVKAASSPRSGSRTRSKKVQRPRTRPAKRRVKRAPIAVKGFPKIYRGEI